MHEDLNALSEREKETLRLLLAGHDAKSMARGLGLSVHTVNERLRDARRKLGVSSSREAARRLADAEHGDPNSLADKQMGVARTAADVPDYGQPDRHRRAGHPLAWLGGGMLVMSLIVAAIVLSPAIVAGGTTQTPGALSPAATAVTARVAEPASGSAARAWLALLDRQRWAESWTSAGALFRSQVLKQGWVGQVQSARQPLGSVSSRVLLNSTKATSLPGAPAGEYEVLEFRTRFADKPDAIERITLARENLGWKVVGYYIL